MCGRYAASKNPEDLVEEFEVDIGPSQSLPPDWNVSPTKSVYAVVERSPKDSSKDSPDSGVQRELIVARWGLVPSWAKDPSIGSRMINARVETVAEKPAYRRAFSRRRCLVPADGYYEWAVREPGPDVPVDKKGNPRKQAWYIHPADGSSLAMAGLYEFWRDPSRAPDDPASWWTTMTVLTTSVTDSLGQIHDRMPLLVARDRWDQWLDPTIDGSDPGALVSLLIPAAQGRLQAYAVSDAVNNVRNNGPELAMPIPDHELIGAPGSDGSGDSKLIAPEVP